MSDRTIIRAKLTADCIVVGVQGRPSLPPMTRAASLNCAPDRASVTILRLATAALRCRPDAWRYADAIRDHLRRYDEAVAMSEAGRTLARPQAELQ